MIGAHRLVRLAKFGYWLDDRIGCYFADLIGDFVNFAFSPEQEELRRSVRRFLEDKSPSSEVRRLMETENGYDSVVWTLLASQLGLVGLAIPEAYGGSGYGSVELGIVFEEMGRALYCGPYFSTVALAANAIMNCADESANAEFLPAIAAGEAIAALAITEDDGSWDISSIATTASRGEDGWALSGSKSYVIDAMVADIIVVAARSAAGLSVFVVASDAPNMEITPIPTLDTTRKMARISFTGTPASLIGEEGGGSAALERTLDMACVALASEQVGGASRCLEMSVDYAKSRIQFGRPIGSFQAIKHKCADMLVEVESARSAAYYASWVADQDGDELSIAAPLAKAFCSDAYFSAAADTIQIHGGIGFTWEHDAHLYFKRAKASQLLFGDASYHRERLATKVGI